VESAFYNISAIGGFRAWLSEKNVRLSDLTDGSSSNMEKEYVDRAKAIRDGILQLRDSL
jgi:hypothetical protein